MLFGVPVTVPQVAAAVVGIDDEVETVIPVDARGIFLVPLEVVVEHVGGHVETVGLLVPAEDVLDVEIVEPDFGVVSDHGLFEVILASHPVRLRNHVPIAEIAIDGRDGVGRERDREVRHTRRLVRRGGAEAQYETE